MNECKINDSVLIEFSQLKLSIEDSKRLNNELINTIESLKDEIGSLLENTFETIDKLRLENINLQKELKWINKWT